MNTTELIASAKLNGALPEDQDQFNDTNILLLATEEMRERLVPFVMGMNQNFFDFVVRQSLTAGKRKYRLPSRAILSSLVDIQMEEDNRIYPLVPISKTEVRSLAQGATEYFYFEGGSIVLHRAPERTGPSLVYTVQLRPSDLVTPALCGRIVTIDAPLRRLTLDSVPSSFTATSKVDLIKAQSPFEPLQIDNVISTVVGTLLTLTSDLPEDLEVGDYVCPPGKSLFPGVPEDLHSTLALMTASRCLGSLGQLDQKAALDERIKANLEIQTRNIFPRSRGESEKIVSTLL